ncbi:MAG: YopX family protein [bacterium]
MREIKFRAWHKNWGSFANLTEDSDFMAGFNEEGQIYIINNGYPDEKNRDFIIQQFTGFRDSKGKEIYEGDFLQFNNDSSVVRLVVFHQPIGGFGLKYEEKPERILPIIVPLTIERVLAYEIVGNKFENPELLEVKNGNS